MYQFHLIVTALLRYCCAVPLEAKPSIEHVALSDNSTQCTSFLLVWTIRHQAAGSFFIGHGSITVWFDALYSTTGHEAYMNDIVPMNEVCCVLQSAIDSTMSPQGHDGLLGVPYAESRSIQCAFSVHNSSFTVQLSVVGSASCMLWMQWCKDQCVGKIGLCVQSFIGFSSGCKRCIGLAGVPRGCADIQLQLGYRIQHRLRFPAFLLGYRCIQQFQQRCQLLWQQLQSSDIHVYVFEWCSNGAFLAFSSDGYQV